VKQEPSEKEPLSDYVTLKEIDLSVKKGEFIAVVGDIGSGKTSLIKALIGEMINLQKDVLTKVTGSNSFSTKVDESTRARLTQEYLGNSYDLSRPVHEIKDKSVRLDGPVCYVEQEPWILSKNVRDNIIFKIRDEKLNKEHYVNTIKACQLETDL